MPVAFLRRRLVTCNPAVYSGENLVYVIAMDVAVVLQVLSTAQLLVILCRFEVSFSFLLLLPLTPLFSVLFLRQLLGRGRVATIGHLATPSPGQPWDTLHAHLRTSLNSEDFGISSPSLFSAFPCLGLCRSAASSVHS